jgi:hypothetical protein
VSPQTSQAKGAWTVFMCSSLSDFGKGRSHSTQYQLLRAHVRLCIGCVAIGILRRQLLHSCAHQYDNLHLHMQR